MTDDPTITQKKQPLLLRNAVFSAAYICFVVVAMTIMSLNDNDPNGEEHIFRIFITSLGILIYSYLLFPLIRWIAKKYKNLKAGKKLFAPDQDAPKKKWSLLYKILLFLVGYSFFFLLLETLICAFDEGICRQIRFHDFPLFMFISFALMVIWAIYKVIHFIVYGNRNEVLCSIAVWTAVVIIDASTTSQPFSAPAILIAGHEAILLLGVGLYYFLALVAFGALQRKYKQFQLSQNRVNDQ